jgi:hypothetical protein
MMEEATKARQPRRPKSADPAAQARFHYRKKLQQLRLKRRDSSTASPAEAVAAAAAKHAEEKRVRREVAAAAAQAANAARREDERPRREEAEERARREAEKRTAAKAGAAAAAKLDLPARLAGPGGGGDPRRLLSPETQVQGKRLQERILPRDPKPIGASPEVGASHVRISGVVLHQGGSEKPYSGINGEYRRSDKMCNGRHVYTKESKQSIAMWWANAAGKLSWCVGPKESVGGDGMWAYVESEGLGPEEAGGRAWSVYSYNSGAWEEQAGVRVGNLDPEEERVRRKVGERAAAEAAAAAAAKQAEEAARREEARRVEEERMIRAEEERKRLLEERKKLEAEVEERAAAAAANQAEETVEAARREREKEERMIRAEEERKRLLKEKRKKLEAQVEERAAAEAAAAAAAKQGREASSDRLLPGEVVSDFGSVLGEPPASFALPLAAPASCSPLSRPYTA